MASWDESLHARDERGRFSAGSAGKKTTGAEKAAGNAALADFHPRRFANNTEATAYLRANTTKLPAAQRDAVNRYTGDTFFDTNKHLRAGDHADPEVARIDAAMRPLSEDLVVTRHVQPEAFGLTNATLGHVQNLTGRTITDKAFASTALGDPYGGGLGGVTMHIAVPKGTPAILAAGLSRNPTEREVLLDRGQPMAIAKVAKNSRGGWDMWLIALPKDGK
jgi:hypothetical protein